ncbi:Olfactory receptor 7D4 [Sciurus carolinensis]|uniref:Olfactory receptor 7D4 n=1 Tax=Sciurus carolinensis TaxID=30640 RepID=A0AA41MND5_SCICA|nr:Olfactory receptor 7D4 [Sciurus carolinensis]
MEAENRTNVSQFLLLGLSVDPELQPLLFCLLFMYLVTVLGNLLIILAISSDSHLHTPMYFFLSNLSFFGICFSTTVPKMLVNIQAQRKDISYIECLTQLYIFNTYGGVDNFLLSVMTSDCFVAICYPLNYTFIMKSKVCVLLVLISWLIMLWVSLIHILLMKRLIFFVGTEIPHFFCEVTQLLKVTSSDTLTNNIFFNLATALLGVFPMTVIFFSYFQIVSSLMRMSSSVGKYKAFSNCGSHLCGLLVLWNRAWDLPQFCCDSFFPEKFCGICDVHCGHPHAEPLYLYNLRNKDVKDALGRLLSRATSCPS